MNRRVKRRVATMGKLEKVDFPEIDWTRLPNDTVIQIFSCLNHRDRASLSSTCRSWRAVSKSPFLWQTLDLRAHKCDETATSSLSSRCENLEKLHFGGPGSVDAVINLQAKNLKEISVESSRKMTDSSLCVRAARHELLERLKIGPDFCERVSSDAIKAIAICCPKLKTLWLSGMREVEKDAINALSKNCKDLRDVGFVDCRKVDEIALGNVLSLRFVSIAGTTNIKWDLVAENWSKMPFLIGLDVSRTDIGPNTVSRFFSSSSSLKVSCALNCVSLEKDTTFVSNNNYKGKVLISVFTEILEGVATLFVDTPLINKGNNNVFMQLRNFCNNKNLDEILNWVEWVVSNALLRVSESNLYGLDDFWLNQGTGLLLSLMQSRNEEAQERAATALATFAVIDDENAAIHGGRAKAVIRDDGIGLLLNLAESWQEGLQSEAAKAIANLSANAKFAKAVADEGGISILVDLVRSVNRLVAEEAAGGLWNLSVGLDHKGAITDMGGVKALVDIILKWSNSSGGEGVLGRAWFFKLFQERAAGALANLAADDKCGIEFAYMGGIHALVMLARSGKVEAVQEQAIRALTNLAAHGDTISDNAAIGQEAGPLDTLLKLTRSPHDGVKQEAAGALWNLSFDDRNREAIAAAGGVEALVSLARFCPNGSHGLQVLAAGALMGLSVSEATSIAIGQEGGVAPLITLAQSDAEDVHETAAGALWNLAFYPGNALRIVEAGGICTLVHLCSSSQSKMARFMSALALTFMFDGRMDEIALIGTSTECFSKNVNIKRARKLALKHIEAFLATFFDRQAISAAAASSAPAALAQVTESACIQEASHLRCIGAEIGRFVAMLRNPCPTMKSCAAFSLLQFTIPSGRHAAHHVSLLQNMGAPRVLRVAAAAAGAPTQAKIFVRVVLRNLEHHQM